MFLQVIFMSHVDFVENALFWSYGYICWPSCATFILAYNISDVNNNNIGSFTLETQISTCCVCERQRQRNRLITSLFCSHIKRNLNPTYHPKREKGRPSCKVVGCKSGNVKARKVADTAVMQLLKIKQLSEGPITLCTNHYNVVYRSLPQKSLYLPI